MEPQRQGEAIMAKGQKRSTREPKKPKKEKPKPTAGVKLGSDLAGKK
jgi:hypothetical protein